MKYPKGYHKRKLQQDKYRVQCSRNSCSTLLSTRQVNPKDLGSVLDMTF